MQAANSQDEQNFFQVEYCFLECRDFMQETMPSLAVIANRWLGVLSGFD